MQFQAKSFYLRLMIVVSIVVIVAANMISVSYAPAPGKIMHPSYSSIKLPTELTTHLASEPKFPESHSLAEEPVIEENS